MYFARPGQQGFQIAIFGDELGGGFHADAGDAGNIVARISRERLGVETVLAVHAPLSLLTLALAWAIGIMLGFTLLFSALFYRAERITWRTVAAVLLVVPSVIYVAYNRSTFALALAIVFIVIVKHRGNISRIIHRVEEKV